jgi:hypothetical protein
LAATTRAAHADGSCFNRLPHLLQAIPRRDVGVSAKDAGGRLFVHQLEEPELSLFVVDKKVNGVPERSREDLVRSQNRS